MYLRISNANKFCVLSVMFVCDSVDVCAFSVDM